MRAAALAVLVAAVLPATAYAEPEELTDDAAPIVVYQQKTVVDFETVNVGADLVTPTLGFVDTRKPADFNSLVLLRANWDRELVESLTEAW